MPIVTMYTVIGATCGSPSLDRSATPRKWYTTAQAAADHAKELVRSRALRKGYVVKVEHIVELDEQPVAVRSPMMNDFPVDCFLTKDWEVTTAVLNEPQTTRR